jgi:pentatricopeptide repeat protein
LVVAASSICLLSWWEPTASAFQASSPIIHRSYNERGTVNFKDDTAKATISRVGCKNDGMIGLRSPRVLSQLKSMNTVKRKKELVAPLFGTLFDNFSRIGMGMDHSQNGNHYNRLASKRDLCTTVLSAAAFQNFDGNNSVERRGEEPSSNFARSKEASSSLPTSTHNSTSLADREQNLLERRTNELLHMDPIPAEKASGWMTEIRSTMNAWAKTRSKHGAIMVERLLKRLIDERKRYDNENEQQQQNQSGQTSRIKPNTAIYNVLIDAWAKSGERGAAQRAEQILSLMDKSGDPDMRPDVKSFSSVINAWALTPTIADDTSGTVFTTSREPSGDDYLSDTSSRAKKATAGAAAYRAERILDAMEEMYQSGYNTFAKPNTITYNTVISAWARSGDPNAFRHGERLLERMHALQDAGDDAVAPDARSYTALMKAVARSSSDPAQAAYMAEEILQRMKDLSSATRGDETTGVDFDSNPNKHSQVKPTLFTYTTAVQIVSRSPEPNAPRRALALLDEMLDRHTEGDDDVRPNVLVFNAVIAAFARSRQKGAAHQAEQLLQQMEQMAALADDPTIIQDYQEEGLLVRPNVQSYILVMEGYSRSNEDDGAERAVRVHERMINLYSRARERELKIVEVGEGITTTATKLDFPVAKPTVDSFNEVIEAWAYRGNPQKAQETFDEMEAMYRGQSPSSSAGGVHVDVDDSSKASPAFLVERDDDPDCKPNTDSYSALMEAWGATSGEDEGARKAEYLLSHIEQEYDAGNGDVRPDLRCYTSVIEAHARSGEEGSAQLAEDVLRRMIERYETHLETSGGVKPDARCFSAVMDAFSRSGERHGSVFKAENLFRKMHDMNVPTEVFSFTTVINALVRTGEQGAAQKAQDILEWMEGLSQSGQNIEMTPNTITYSAVINAWAKSGEPDGAEKAESILYRMIELYDAGSSNVKLDVIAFTSVMNAWSRSGIDGAPERAEKLLQVMEERYDHGRGVISLKPDSYVYNTLISAWSWSSDSRGAQKAEEYLQQLEEMHRNNTDISNSKDEDEVDESVRPTTFSYNQVIHALCKHGDLERAENYLLQMELLVREDGREELTPNSQTFFALIKAYSQRKTMQDAEGAERLLIRMLDWYHEKGTVDFRPTPAMFNLAINAWSKYVSVAKGQASNIAVEAAGRAEALLREMIALNDGSTKEDTKRKLGKVSKHGSSSFDDVKTQLYCFASVINAYSKSGARDSARKAYNLLQEMKVFHSVESSAVGAIPFSISFSSVINALSRTSGMASASLADDVLRELESIEESQEKLALGPSSINYNYVINAYTKVYHNKDEGIDKSEAVLKRMEKRFAAGYKKAMPNTVSYNIILNALCKNGGWDAGRRSLTLLQRMERLYRATHNKDVKPELRTYTACIQALSRSKDRGSPQLAERLLERLELMYKRGDESLRPDRKVYTSVINCWTHSKEPQKAIHAQRVLHRMQDAYRKGNSYSKPDLFTYNTVMLACAFSKVQTEEERREAMKVAYQTYRQVKGSGYPELDDALYSSFLKACNNLMPFDNSRTQIVKAVFKRCCKDGAVSSMVLSELRRTPSNLLQVDEIVSHTRDLKELPSTWTRNVNVSNKYKKRKLNEHRANP